MFGFSATAGPVTHADATHAQPHAIFPHALFNDSTVISLLPERITEKVINKTLYHVTFYDMLVLVKTLVLADVQEQPDFECQRAFAYAAKPPDRRAAHVTVNSSRDLGPFLRCERFNSFGGVRGGLHGPRDLEWLSGLNLECLKTWVSVDAPDRFDRYLATASEVSDELMLTVGGHHAVQDGRWSLDKFESHLTGTLLALKRRHPKCVWVECLNEFRTSDGSWTNPRRFDEYFAFYRVFRDAIDEVNRVLRPERPLLLGGPVTTSLYEGWLQEWIDRCVAHDVRIDFLSYHQYLFGLARGRPARIGFERDVVRGILGRRELDPQMPIFVTETGVFPGGPFQMTDDFDADLLTQAAGLLSNCRYYIDAAGDAERGVPVPFQWITRHDEHPWKNQLVREWDGVPTPYGHAIGFLSRLGRQRVAADSDSIDPNGTGLHAIATRGGGVVSVLLWNYQWVDGRATFDATVRLQRLNGRRGSVRRIGRTASNYRAIGPDAAYARCEAVAIPSEPAGARVDLCLEPNEIVLLEIEEDR